MALTEEQADGPSVCILHIQINSKPGVGYSCLRNEYGRRERYMDIHNRHVYVRRGVLVGIKADEENPRAYRN